MQPTLNSRLLGTCFLHLLQHNTVPTALLEMFSTMNLNDPNNNDWYIDNGTTDNLHPDPRISDHVNCSFVFVGDGSKIVVNKIGNTDLSYLHPYHPLTLKNVLITPNIIKNLIYVRRFTDDNWCSIEFDPFGFHVKDLQTKQILLRCDIKYYVIFLDNFTHFVWVYPLRFKSDVFSKFVHFRQYVKNQFKTEI